MSRASYTLDIGGTAVEADTEVGSTRLRWTRGMDQVRALAPPVAGELGAELHDNEGTYSLDASPIERGQDVTLEAVHDAVTYSLFAGILDRPQLGGEQWHEIARVNAFGTLSRLADKTGLSTALYQDIRTDEAIGYVLDAIDWPVADRALDAGQTMLRWWWLDGVDAFTALLQLWASEGPTAALYEDGQGRIVFRNRHAVLTETRSTVVQASYGVGNLPLIEPWAYSDGLQDVVNTATVTVARREAGIQSVVWEYGGDQDVIEIGANETRKIRARASGDDLMLNAITPLADAGDYEVRLGSITAVSIDRTSGPSIEITLTAGADGATVGGLLLRATPVSLTSEIEISNSNHPLSAGETPRPYQLEVWPYMDPLLARDFVDAIVQFWRNGRPQVTFSTINASDAALTALLEREIGDRVHVAIPRLGIDEDVIVLQRSDEVSAGLVHRVTFGCEEIVDIDLFILDTSQLDVDELSF